MSALTSRRTTPAYFRAVSSAVTIPMIAPGESSTSSSSAWSVHGSSFAPLVTRKKKQADADARGKMALRFAAITCSRGTQPAWSGSGTQRGRLAGTLIRTKRGFLRPGSLTSTARLRPRLLMNGNGCAASAASGTRIGSTESMQYRARKSRWDGPRSPTSRIGTPRSRSAGRNCSSTELATSFCWDRSSARQASSTSAAVRPSGPRLARSLRACRSRPPIRFMANSS